MAGKKILIVDDDKGIRKLLKISLESNQYDVIESDNVKDGINFIANKKPDLIILDLQFPDILGLELVKTVREWTQIPIIVISVLSSDKDKISLLDAGVDDYLTKPFSIGELLARIRVAFRKIQINPDNDSVFLIGKLKIDTIKRRVFKEKNEIHLTPIEYSFLALFAKNCGKIITHQQIINEIWGPFGLNETNSIRVHIASLRKKLEIDPSHPEIILNEPGIGYRINID